MKCQVLIDYLTFSIKNTQEPVEVITKYLGMDPVLFQEAPYGLMGYQRCLIFSDIRVLYEPLENQYFHDMGVCVTMSDNGYMPQGRNAPIFKIVTQLHPADPRLRRQIVLHTPPSFVTA